MTNPGIKNWFKKNSNPISEENVVCKNCDTKFNGEFCPNCGQSIRDYDKPFSFIIYNFAGDFFAFDTRFFHTFVALLFKPGFLTKEYFEGRRVKYAPPFRVFIFISFVLFLLLQMYTNKGITTVLDSSWSEENSIGIDSTLKAITDSIFSGIHIQVDSLSDPESYHKLGLVIDSANSDSAEYKFDMDAVRSVSDLRHSLKRYAQVIDEKLKTETDPEEQASLRKVSRLLSSPEQVTAKILKYMSWAFFLLLPIFAVLLKLVYIRRKHNYIRHLIFSIHTHSFIFVILTFIIGLHLIFTNNLGGISIVLILTIPIYFIIALKKFYGQSIVKVILKFLSVSFLYNIIFWIVVGFVIWNAFSF